jgi:ectoine hydroxylase-related dioxygenase (phytanoyl-CoA dioxygenase family)
MTNLSRYGVTMTAPANDEFDLLAEELRLLGYATLGSGLTEHELDGLSELFDAARVSYAKRGKADGVDLEKLNEQDTIRILPLEAPRYWSVVFNPRLHQLLSRLLGSYFILNQVNGLINRGNRSAYHQAQYHRDLPYQHFTSSKPLAFNALFALDDFTVENGATRVIPASHHREAFPSDGVVAKVEKQVTVKRGTFIVLDCMLYHAGSVNMTARDRRAVNHVFTIPLLRQQFHFPSVLGDGAAFSAEQKKILGYGLQEYRSISDWFRDRASRI